MNKTALVERIEIYAAARDMSATTFGRKAVNDGKLVERLRAGKTITLDTLNKIERFMAEPPRAAQPSVSSEAAA
jgi:hypothetical protein